MRKFLSLSLKDKFLLLEAFIYLGFARAALLIVPFERMAPYLGKQLQADQAPLTNGAPPTIARKICWSIEVMAYRTPWESACLAQAVAGKLMLKRRKLTCLMYLGMRKDPKGEFMAHAWLQSGGVVLLGGHGHETFKALSVFIDGS